MKEETNAAVGIMKSAAIYASALSTIWILSIKDLHFYDLSNVVQYHLVMTKSLFGLVKIRAEGALFHTNKL